MNQQMKYDSPREASKETGHPGNMQAGYGKLLDDYEIEDDPQVDSNDPFYDNLALHLPSSVLDKIGSELTELIESDDLSRQKWLRVCLDGIDYLGLGGDRVKNTVNYKPTDIYAPTLMTSGQQVASSLFARFFPPNGFCQTEIMGFKDEENEDQATRICEGMEELTKNIMPEYKANKKQSFIWMVFCGSVFTKVYMDKLRNKPAAPFIRPDDVIIDALATSLDDAERITHRFYISERILDEYIQNDIWRDTDIEANEVDQNKSLKAKIDTKTQGNPVNDDIIKSYAFDETMCYLDLDSYSSIGGHSSGLKCPYLVVKDHNSDAIVGIYRHWDPDDKLYKPKEYLIQHKFFPGFNVYGLGLFHLCLGLARAETDLLQQLILAAKYSNNAALMMATGLKSERSQLDINPGSLVQFQTFEKTIGDAIQPFPFKEPSSIYLDLMNICSTAIHDRAITNQMKPDDIPSNVSTTTMMGIMSLMQIQESALLNDLYDSFRKEFQLLFTIFGEWLPDTHYPFLVPGGERVLMKKDFSPNIAIRPIVDPNQSSQTFQLVTNEAVMGLATQNPELYNMRAVHVRMLKSMKIDDIDSIMVPEEPEDPPPLDPVTENTYVTSGQPIKAYKIQDHEAHSIVHQDMIVQLMNQQEGGQTDNGAFIAALQSHIREHANFAYVLEMEHRMNKELPDDPTELSPKEQNKIAKEAAEVIINQQQEQMQNQPPPIDPNQVVMEELRVEQFKTEAKMQEAQNKLQIEQQRLMQDDQRNQAQFGLDQAKLDIERQKLMNDQQHFELEKMKLETQLQIEQMKLQMQQREQDIKLQLGAQDIEAEDRKTASMIESKAYEATLRHEDASDKEVEYAKIQADREKATLDAEVKSYSATLDFNKEEVNPNGQGSIQI